MPECWTAEEIDLYLETCCEWDDDMLIADWYNGSGCALKDAQQTITFWL
jgi:hypothetical protein